MALEYTNLPCRATRITTPGRLLALIRLSNACVILFSRSEDTPTLSGCAAGSGFEWLVFTTLKAKNINEKYCAIFVMVILAPELSGLF